MRDNEDARFEALFSPGNLRKTWNTIRRELRQTDLRDAIDWLDWASQVDANLPALRADLLAGTYQPMPPARYELGKTRGSFRFMTVPSVRDSLVFRHISDAALEEAGPGSASAFFSKRHSRNPVGDAFPGVEDPSDALFVVWMRYQEYRTRTLLNRPFALLIVTDITNYFDSIEHDLLLEYLAPLGLPRKAIGTLGRLLEMLKPPAGHSPNPRVGLPVDELDCSRQLAHLFLYEHDKAVIAALGPRGDERYVRWMDDQNIGVDGETEARQTVNLLTRSLQRQRLVLNGGKTKFLAPGDVVAEFHLDTNEELNAWEKRWKTSGYRPEIAAAGDLEVIWLGASQVDGEGHWDKVLKRFYGAAAKCNASFLDDRVGDDIIAYPHLAPRAFQSLALRGETNRLLTVFRRYVQSGESLFEATEAQFFDAMLLADISAADEGKALRLVRWFLRRRLGDRDRGRLGVASAIVAHWWLGGDVRSLLAALSGVALVALPPQAARSLLSVAFARSPKVFDGLAPRFVGHASDDVARLVEFLFAVRSGEIGALTFEFAHQRPRWPRPGRRYDARGWLALDLLSRTGSVAGQKWIAARVRRFEKLAQTAQEKRVLKRVRGRMGI